MNEIELYISQAELNEYVSCSVGCSDEQYYKFLNKLEFVKNEYVENLLGFGGMSLFDRIQSVQNHFKCFIANLAYASILDSEDNVENMALNDRVTIAKWWFQAVTDYEKTVKLSIYKDVLYAYDLLVKRLMLFPEWRSQLREVANAIPFPIWNIRQIEQRYGVNVNYSFFFNFIKKERGTVNVIIGKIGERMYNRLMSWVRNAGFEDELYHRVGEYLLDQIEGIIFAKADGDYVRMDELMHRMLYHLEKNLSDFPEYAESDEYHALIAERYENKQDDSAFFFG